VNELCEEHRKFECRGQRASGEQYRTAAKASANVLICWPVEC